MVVTVFFFFQAEDGIRDVAVTGVQTCALPISPAEAIAHTVVLHGAPIGVSAEGFALAGDVHLWLGNLAPEDYTVPTPDGRPATRQFAGRSEEHTSELQSRLHLVCRLLLEKKKKRWQKTEQEHIHLATVVS